MANAARDEPTLADRIFELQKNFVKRLNDSHVSIQVAIPGIATERDELLKSNKTRARRYVTPRLGKPTSKAARRDHEVAEILGRYMDREIYEAAIIAAVSLFEAYLADVLTDILTAYPDQLRVPVKDNQKDAAGPEVSVDTVLKSKSYEKLIALIIAEKRQRLFYAAPEEYLKYVGKVIGVDVKADAFKQFMEIKAARDLIVHNRSQINEAYMKKAGAAARGKQGQELAIDSDYFNTVVAVLKQCAVNITSVSEDKWDK